MRKNKKQLQLAQNHHQRKSSALKERLSRTSHPRLSLNPTPPKILSRQTSNHFLSNPTSLEKKKPKPKVHKKGNKLRKKAEQPTQATLEEIGDCKWKQHLKLTFRSSHQQSKEISLHNNSLKCMEDLYEQSARKPAESYSALVKTFPNKNGEGSIIGSKERIFLLDWMGYVCAELICRRNTFHMAVAFVDGYLARTGEIPAKLQCLGAGAILLAVKQEERGTQTYVLNVLSGNGSGLSREEILEFESLILLQLNFKLNFSTLSFWCDYFSQKWDGFIEGELEKTCRDGVCRQENLILLRSPQGLSYRHYREMMQLADCLLFDGEHRKFNFSELALAIIYLVVRIQSEARIANEDVRTIFSDYCKGFDRKASPIFNDRYNFNAIFNEYTTQICHFEITEIIPMIKWVGKFLGMTFSSDIDGRIYQSATNYQEFLRYASYSYEVRNYQLQKLGVGKVQ